MVFGQFKCPIEGYSFESISCCGPDKEQYCCEFETTEITEAKQIPFYFYFMIIIPVALFSIIMIVLVVMARRRIYLKLKKKENNQDLDYN